MSPSVKKSRRRVGNLPPAAPKGATPWQAVKSHLEAEKRRIVAEIRGYPPPIAGCDAQYQHLTERRHLIAQELVRLEAAQGNGAAAINAFLVRSAVIDEATARKLRDQAPPSTRPR